MPPYLIVNSLGLLLDVVGVVVLYLGLRGDIRSKGDGILLESAADLKWYEKHSAVGLWMVVVGFLLQLASNFISR